MDKPDVAKFVDPDLEGTEGLSPQEAEELMADDVYDPLDNGNQPG